MLSQVIIAGILKVEIQDADNNLICLSQELCFNYKSNIKYYASLLYRATERVLITTLTKIYLKLKDY